MSDTNKENERIMYNESLCKDCIKCNLNNNNAHDSCEKANWCNWQKQCDKFKNKNGGNQS